MLRKQDPARSYESLALSGALELGVDGSTAEFLSLRAATDDPRLDGLAGNLGDVVFYQSAVTGPAILIKTGAGATDWSTLGGAKAEGSITVPAAEDLADGDNFTIDDGINDAVIYEFDDDDEVTEGSIAIDLTDLTTAASVAVVVVAAIEANQPALALTDNEDGTIDIVHRVPGTFANATITEDVTDAGFSVTGMTGGEDPLVA